MNPPADGSVLLSGRVMQWLSSSPPGRSRDCRKRKYAG